MATLPARGGGWDHGHGLMPSGWLRASQVRGLLRQAQLEKLKAERKDLYGVLELPKTASSLEIKKAYRKMALKYHPDKQSGCTEEERADAEAKFKELTDAYDVLSNPEKKQRYDSGADLEEEMDGGGHFGHSHMDPEMFNMFQSFMGGGGGGGHQHHHGQRRRGGHPDPYSARYQF